VKDVKHLTILLAVDATNMTNGGLEVVEKSQNMSIPLGADNCLLKSWVESHAWKPAELAPGEVLIFGSYLAHRSGANKSLSDRKAIYATYNCASDGDLHDAYYEDRKRSWPATHLRVAGQDYAEGAMRYGFGSPMLSVESGAQLEF
jgi:2-aminoethylphosphonate dioxygenase